MAVKIRLKRMGMKKKPFYRVVVADIRSPRDGRFIDEIGYYNPLTNPAEIKIDCEKAQKWLGNGAQPTETVRILLKKVGVLECGPYSKANASPVAAPVEAAKAVPETAAEAAPEAAAEEAPEAAADAAPVEA